MDIASFSGQRSCVDPGSIAQDSLCDVGASGDAACENVCAEVLLNENPPIGLGVCGECKEDADCMGGTCTPGSFSGMSQQDIMLIGSTCSN